MLVVVMLVVVMLVVVMLVVVMLVVVTFKAVPDPLTLTVVACGGYEREGDVRRW
jgi:hypothetical protein